MRAIQLRIAFRFFGAGLGHQLSRQAGFLLTTLGKPLVRFRLHPVTIRSRLRITRIQIRWELLTQVPIYNGECVMAETPTKVPVRTGQQSTAATPFGRHPFEAFRREMDRLFDDFGRGFWPSPFPRSLFDVAPFGRGQRVGQQHPR